LALAVALGGPRWPLACFGLALGLLLMLAAGQTAGIVLHAVSRNRRVHDRVLFAGIGLGVLLSLSPVLVLGGGGSAARRLLLALLERDVFVLSPFAWSARAAVHAGRGELLAFLGWSAAVAVAFASAVGISAAIAHRLYRGELDTGVVSAAATSRARMRRARWAPSSRRTCARRGATRA
jgi:hypothetical protein